MSHNMYMSYRAVACIQKPPEERTDEEIGGLVPWLRNMSRVLADAKQGTPRRGPAPTRPPAAHHYTTRVYPLRLSHRDPRRHPAQLRVLAPPARRRDHSPGRTGRHVRPQLTPPPTHSISTRTQRRAHSFYIILSGRVGIFINTDLSAGGPELANGGGADQRASPNDEAPNRAALGNYIKSLGAFADTPLARSLL